MEDRMIVRCAYIECNFNHDGDCGLKHPVINAFGGCAEYSIMSRLNDLKSGAVSAVCKEISCMYNKKSTCIINDMPKERICTKPDIIDRRRVFAVSSNEVPCFNKDCIFVDNLNHTCQASIVPVLDETADCKVVIFSNEPFVMPKRTLPKELDDGCL